MLHRLGFPSLILVIVGGAWGADPAPKEDRGPAARALLDIKGTNQYNTASFSPDGKYFAFTGADRCLKVCETAGGKEIHSLGGHPRGYLDVVFSPDGKHVAAGGQEGARVWELATGKQHFFAKAQNYVTRIAFSPDAQYLATADSPGLVVWDLRTGLKRCVMDGNRTRENTVAFTPDGRFVASGNSPRVVRIWDAATGKMVRTLTAHKGAVHTIAFTPDGKQLASASLDKTIRLWDPDTGAILHTLEGHLGGVHTVAYSPDGRYLVSAGMRQVKLWDAQTGTELYSFEPHTSDVFSATFSPDGRRLVTTAQDGRVRLWDLGDIVPAPAPVTRRELPGLWDDLTAEPSPAAFRAVFALSASPGDVVPFLCERLRPAPLGVQEPGHVARLIADLDDDRFVLRQKASAELAKLGRAIEPALQRALEAKPPLEVRRRLEVLLERLQNEDLSPEQRRETRAVEVLERIGTPEAKAILETVSDGDPHACLTRAAKAALRNLATIPAR